MTHDVADEPRPLALVVEEGRGSLPFELLRGEALVSCAAWALGEAEAVLVDVGTPWSDLVYLEAPVVLHDPLCPLTPAEFLVDCTAQAVAEDVVVVGVRPVTDTVKQVRDGEVGSTVDRDELWTVCSPVVLPARVVAAYQALPAGPDHDFAALVAALTADGHTVRFVTAPPEARRVASPEDVRVLEALSARAAAAPLPG